MIKQNPMAALMTLLAERNATRSPAPPGVSVDEYIARHPELKGTTTAQRHAADKKAVDERLYANVKAQREQKHRANLLNLAPGQGAAAVAHAIASAEAKAIAAFEVATRPAAHRAHRPNPIVLVKEGPLSIRRVTPDRMMPEWYDGPKFAFAKGYAAEYLAAGDNEGSSSATQADTDLAVTQPSQAWITALKLSIVPDLDSPPVQGGVATIGFYDLAQAGFGPHIEVQEPDGTSGVGGQESLTQNTEIAITFDHPARGASVMYVHLCRRPSSVAGIVAATALLLQPRTSLTANFSALATARNITVDWRTLGASDVNVHAEAVAPGLPAWDEYVDFMRDRGYTTL